MLSFLMGDENLQVIEITLAFEALADVSMEGEGEGGWGDTYSNNTRDERGAPRRRDGRASSCPPFCRG